MTFISELLLVGFAIASIAITISKSNVTEPLRIQVSRLGRWAEELVYCPYCLSHWLAFGAVWWKWGLLPLDQFIIASFGLVTIASLASLGIIWLFLALNRLDSEENE